MSVSRESAMAPLDCKVRIESYKTFEKHPSVPIPMGILQISLRRRLRVLQTSTDDSKDDEKLYLREEIVYPELVKVLDFPRYVLASPKYMKLDIVDMLESLELDSDLCDSLSPMMESFVMAASTSFGAENFVVIAHVEVVNTEVIGEETYPHLYESEWYMDESEWYMDSESESESYTDWESKLKTDFDDHQLGNNV